jgi:hypothetical protein
MGSNRLVATAQIALSIVYTVGYFFVLQNFLDGKIRTPPEWKDVLTTLISLLTAGVLMILQFWFSRSRQSEPPPAQRELG